MRILVAGGTGTVGREVAALAAARGHDVVVVSRSGPVPVDLTTGDGLAQAMAGVEAVVDCSNIASMARARAERFFVAETQNLVRAGAEAGVRHHVLLSIVGIDQVPTGYYQAKVAQEAAMREAAAEAGPGYTILRATQFHDFAGQLLGRTRKGPFALIPVMRTQPVEVTAVARRLVELAESEPSGRAADLGGPRPEDLTDLARQLCVHRGDRVRVVGLPIPGKAGRAIRAGALLVPSGTGRTFSQWLADQPVS